MSDGQSRQEHQAPPLPPGLDLLWGRRGPGKRGPRPGLTPDAIVAAAIEVADAEGLEAVSMSRVAKQLGFTTMSLYRHVASKDELLQLMWNASATGAEGLVLEGEGWRERLRMWATVQRDVLDQHAWITQMPLAGPPLGPNSMHFIERGLQALDGSGLTDADKLRFLGLISSYTLQEARMANDAARAAEHALEAGLPPDPTTMPNYEAMLRELVDEETYPRVHRLAWAAEPGKTPDEHAEFLWGLDRLLDAVQALIDQTTAASEEGAPLRRAAAPGVTATPCLPVLRYATSSGANGRGAGARGDPAGQGLAAEGFLGVRTAARAMDLVAEPARASG